MTKASLSGLAFLIDLAQEGDSQGGLPPSLRCAPAALAGYAGKRLTPFPQLRTLAGSNPCEGNEKASNWARFIT